MIQTLFNVYLVLMKCNLSRVQLIIIEADLEPPKFIEQAALRVPQTCRIFARLGAFAVHELSTIA